MLRIGLDLDDCIFDWYPEYLKRFGQPKDDYEITKNVQRILRKDKVFWENLPILNIPDFIPSLFCTKRVNSKVYTKNSLRRIGLHKVPVYQLFTQSANKADKIKNKVDVFIDDSISNWKQMNLSGLPCLLINNTNNEHIGPLAKVYSLRYDHIEDTYDLFMKTIFPIFKDIKW